MSYIRKKGPHNFRHMEEVYTTSDIWKKLLSLLLISSELSAKFIHQKEVPSNLQTSSSSGFVHHNIKHFHEVAQSLESSGRNVLELLASGRIVFRR